MLTSRINKYKLINNKKEINILINSHKNFILINLFLFLTIFYLLSKTNNLFNKSKFDFFNQILINSGFTIKNIEVLGANHLDKDDIIKIVRTYNNVNIFKVNIKDIYRKIKNNTWIKKASIQVIYPNTIKILLTEKKPIAIWQNRYGNNLITETGDVILEKNLDNFKVYLPIIIGDNANNNIHSILNIFSSNKDFFKNVWSLTFINERRWDVHFNQGLTIRLPSKNVGKAWEKVVHLDQNYNILSLGLTEIDLRNPNQILGKINVDKKLINKKKNS